MNIQKRKSLLEYDGPIVIPSFFVVGEKCMERQYSTVSFPGYSFTVFNDSLVDQLISDIEISAGKRWLTTKAMWDTGAQFSCITKRLAMKLGLEPVDTRTVFGLLAQEERNLYKVTLILPGKIMIPDIYLIEGGFEKADFDIVVGMDIIGRGDFAVSNYDNKTTFTYRIASKECADYTTDFNEDK